MPLSGTRTLFPMTTDQKTAFVVDPLVLRPSVTLCAHPRQKGYKVHEVKQEWSPKTAQTRNCSFLVAFIVEQFVYAPADT